MRRPIRSIRILITTLVVSASIALAAVGPAHAGTYWWNAGSDLMTPTNGFHWSGDSVRMNYWANRCEARSGTTYSVGTGCSLSWYVPANLDATGGHWTGTHRSSSGAFRVVRSVEGNGTTVVQSGNTAAGYTREWPDVASYIRMTFEATSAHAISTGTAQFASMDSFAIALVDPHRPGLNILSGHDGWKGPAGACIRYGYGEAGSGLQATALVNVNTGAVYDNPGYGSANITTGVFQNDRNCVGVGALPTGHYTFRASAVDKSGNGANNDFTVSFDTTPPALSDIASGGTAVANGRVFTGSATGYRPAFSVTANDAHVGMSSVQVFIDGAHVANGTSYTPPARLSLGAHTVRFRAIDALGNESNVTRSFEVRDDVKPSIAVEAPGTSGDNTPVLDATATDDFSGVNASTWTVRVNGVTVPSSTTSSRLQLSLGRLVNGTHAIELRVSDNAGNQYTQTVSYTASGDTYTPPGLTGIYVLQSPSVVDEGSDYHVVAIAVKDGRPITTGRYEASKVGAANVLAGKSTTSDGSVDLLVENAVDGPMQLALTGSGLPAAAFTFTFRAKGTSPYCEAHPTDATCRVLTGGGDNTSTGTGGTGTGTSGSGTSGATGTTGGSGTQGVTGGTNAGTSGGPNDKVAPKFTLRAIQLKKGVTRRTGVIHLRFTSNERANYTLQPIGSRAVKSNMTTKARVLKVKLTGALLKRIRNAKTPMVAVKVRVVGIDPNKNVVRKTITLRIRR